MDILQYTSLQTFLQSFSRIRRTMSEWRLAELSLAGQKETDINEVASKLQKFFNAHEGTVFICNSHELIALIRMGASIPSSQLADEIRDSVREYDCFVTAEDVTESGLGKIVLQIIDKTKEKAVIMVADDDMYMRSLAVSALKPFGTVYEADDGASAVESFRKFNPDVVFLDIHMPGRSGMDVLKEIMAASPDTSVVMLSADSVKDNIIEAQNLGAKAFITKPFTKGTVQAKFQQCYFAS